MSKLKPTQFQGSRIHPNTIAIGISPRQFTRFAWVNNDDTSGVQIHIRTTIHDNTDKK